MSHFKVAVIVKDLKDVEKVLAPYQETETNTKGKWDWYNICSIGNGARFSNTKIPLGYCKVKDYNMKLDKKAYNQLIREWEILVENKPLKRGEEEPFRYYTPEYYLERYETKENYATVEATPHTWAFVCEGKWYEQGEMGWFAMDNATIWTITEYLMKFKEVMNDEKYQDYYLVMVDCHI